MKHLLCLAFILYYFSVVDRGPRVRYQKMFYCISHDKSAIVIGDIEYSASINYSVITYYLGDCCFKRNCLFVIFKYSQISCYEF